jgi:hypothetical protein
MKSEQVKDRAQDTLDELKTLRDEIRVNLHLAGMDLRDEWKQLERRLPDGQAFDKVKDATRDALGALTQELRRFRDRLRAPQPPAK